MRFRQLSDRHHSDFRPARLRARWPRGNRLLAGCALALSGALGSALPSAADDSTQSAAANTAGDAVQTAAIAAIAQGRSLLDERAWPASVRLSVYVGQNQPGVLIQNLSLIIDQNPPLSIELTPAMSAALADSNGLLRVGRSTLAAGTHSAHAKLSYIDRDAAVPKPIALEWDGAIDKQPGELAVEISLKRNLSGTSAKIETAQWQLLAINENWFERALRGVARRNSVIGLFHPGDDRDPAGRYARYLVALGQAERALIELQDIAAGKDPSRLPIGYWLRRADTYRAANLLADAAAICDRLASLGGDRHDIAMQRLHLAQAEYGRGELQRAQSLLLLARADVPDIYALNWRFAYAQLLFAQNRVAEATELLKTPDSDYVEALRYMNQPVESLRESGYSRYNLAVELLTRGEQARGLSWLDLVGRAAGSDAQILALRDQANLVLGWHFLKAKQGRTALGILGRVRAEGPYSDAALLGIGWSELVPAGDIHWRSRLSAESKKQPEYVIDLPPVMRRSLLQLKVLEPELHGGIGPRSFSNDRPPDDRSQGLQRALQLWRVLADRNRDSPASQEAALAIGYAYDQLHDPLHARDAYLQAVRKLELARASLTASATAIRSGSLTVQLAQAADAFDLLQTLSRFGFAPEALNRSFYTALDRYRANAGLLDALADLQTQLAGPTPQAATADDPAGIDANPIAAADAATSGRITDSTLPARLDTLRQTLVAEQQQAAPQLADTALNLLDGQQQVLNTYLKAAYFSAARLQDNRPASDRLGP